MATDTPGKPDDWTTPREFARNSGVYRRRSRRELSREEALGDWYGEGLSEAEIEAHQAAPRQLGKLIDSVFAELNMGDKALLRRIIEAWPKLVGDEIARCTDPQSIRQGILLVAVADATWRYRLQRETRYLSDRLRDFTEGAVTGLKLVPGGRSATRPT